jgi:aspartyl-tRNA(Asn)/glutamyl-tRNA(Gln) amidotransferase subunit A
MTDNERHPSSVIPRAPGLRRALEALTHRRITVSDMVAQALDAAESAQRILRAFAAIDAEGALLAPARANAATPRAGRGRWKA